MLNLDIISSLEDEEIRGLSFFMAVPSHRRSINPFKTKDTNQVVYFNPDHFPTLLDQMRESSLTVARIFSHFPNLILTPHLANGIEDYKPNEESVIAVLMRDLITQLEGVKQKPHHSV